MSDFGTFPQTVKWLLDRGERRSVQNLLNSETFRISLLVSYESTLVSLIISGQL